MAPSNIHEYIKLRQHFINLTLHADPECPLPSERTLAETFGVARKTVRRALEDMVAGNYLIKRPRRGYFVNPLSMREDERRQKIVGLLFRNGMHALYNREDACFMEAFFREIRRYDACVQLIMTSGTEMIYSDIANSGLDGLVWLGVPPGHTAVFERIHREGALPIVGFFDSVPPACGNYIYMDPFTEGYQKTKFLLDRGCRSILFVKCPRLERSHDGYSAALKEAGIAPNPELLVDEELPSEQLEALFREHTVDGAVVRFHQADRVREFAVSRGIRIPEDLQLITGCTCYDWEPTMTEKPFAAIVSRLLNQLWNEMQHQDSPLQDSSLQWNIKAGNSTR